MRVLGIDEAGRGSVLGSMMISGVAGDKSFFDSHNFPDSKEISKSKRNELYDEIHENCECITLSVTPKLIDDNENLDYLEWKVMDSLLLGFEFDVAFIDIVGDQEKQKSFFLEDSSMIDDNIVVKEDADKKYDVVGASSIISKVERDEEIETMSKRFGDVGSGYPSDSTTREWIKSNINDLPDSFVRKSWSTIEKIKESV
jgi:ribonuclease HII